jgi:murein DD-endopeptidase MepM/ murein hydrolase activator NlpD
MFRATAVFLVLGVFALAGPRPATAQDAPAEAQARAQSTHIVQSGETLGSIASRYLGSAAEWRAIYDANRDRIANPDRIRVGMELVIPGVGSVPAAAAQPAFAAEIGVDAEAAATDHVARRELVRPRPLRPQGTPTPTGDRTIFFEVHQHDPEDVSQVLLTPTSDLPAVPEGIFHSASWIVPPGESLDAVGVVVGLAGDGPERPDRNTILPVDEVLVTLVDGRTLSPGDRVQSVRVDRDRPGLGHVLVPTAVLEVVRLDPAGAVVRVERDIGKAQIDDLVYPMRSFPLTRGVHPAETDLRLEATVLGFEDRKELYLPGDRLYIDRGSRDGVGVGDEFAGVAGSGNGWEGRVFAHFQVVYVQEERATVRILRVTDPQLLRPGLPAMLVRKMP